MRPVVHDIALLECGEVPAPPAGLAGCHSAELGRDQQPQIQAIHAQLGHRLQPARALRRLDNGLRFIVLFDGAEPIASTWIVSGGARYIDELNWLLPVAADAFWLRDVVVVPSRRGQHVFRALLAAIAARHVVPCRTLWSDVDWVNQPSMRAHLSAGFQVRARLRALDLFGRLRIRSALPPWPLPVAEIDPGARCVWLRGATRARHQALIA